jgi:hypothetical protein
MFFKKVHEFWKMSMNFFKKIMNSIFGSWISKKWFMIFWKRSRFFKNVCEFWKLVTIFEKCSWLVKIVHEFQWMVHDFGGKNHAYWFLFHFLKFVITIFYKTSLIFKKCLGFIIIEMFRYQIVHGSNNTWET